MICRLLLMCALSLAICPQAQAMPPPDRLALLRHGVNLTNWLRYPTTLDPASLRAYLSDTAITDLRRAGFGFVRLAVQPEILMDQGGLRPDRADLLLSVIRRLQRAGLGVVIAPHPSAWHLESDPAALTQFWYAVAPVLAGTDPRRTFPEVLNEPVFPQDPAGWGALQAAVAAQIRAALPGHTIILTGQDWGSLSGLLALRPIADPNVVYSLHFYDPAELTALAAYRPGLDTAALARLPFPMSPQACAQMAATTDPATAALIRFVCAMAWDSGKLHAAFAQAGAWGRSNHAALLLGEFGATIRLNPAARLAWLTDVRIAAEHEGIGWALWGYDDGMGFGIPRPPPARPVLNPDLLRALGLAAAPSRDEPVPAAVHQRSGP